MQMSLAGITCPKCRKPIVWEGNAHRPFCSERCRLLDLGAWADESYRVPDRTPLQTSENNGNNEQ
jgi:endogenous inhibitor of DNA gyrase (YacG/DUF329 family)